MAIDMLIVGVILFICVVVLFVVYLNRRTSRKDTLDETVYTIERLCELCKVELARLTKDDNFIGRSDDEWEALYNRKIRIQRAQRGCVHGILQDKIIVKDLIRNIIASVLTTESKVLDVYDFHSIYLSPMIKFEIIMYKIRKRIEDNRMAFTEMMHQYELDRERRDVEDALYSNYAVTNEDIDEIFTLEDGMSLTYEEELDILATLVYQRIKGMGCVDTLLEMAIDGVSAGVSGTIVTDLVNPGKSTDTAPRSIWCNFEGKYIHLRFLTFYTAEELRRVTLAVCRYNNPGPLTEKRGYIVNTMWDQSRVLAIRPNASEYWCFFIRKFSLGGKELEDLIDPVDDEGNHKYGNAQLALNMVIYLMACMVTCGFTGRQGSGKTTMMVRAVKYIDYKYNIRVLELAPEMYLRELYPRRNILSVAETPYVSAEMLQDALKKSDAAISIVGEVATNVVAARMLQMGQVASLFTIFSHHANTTEDLVNALTNSIVADSHGASTPATAMPQVIDVIKVDVHLDYDTQGNRFIERITQIIGLSSKPYPEQAKGESLEAYKVRLDKEYYTRMTDRRMFVTRDILHFDRNTYSYVADDKFFDKKLTKYMLNHCPLDKREDFIKFVKENWGKGAA